MRTIRTASKRKKILAAMAEGYTDREVAKVSGVSRTAIFEWRKADPEFDAACKDAIEEGTDLIEDTLRNRVLEGVEEPVYWKGVIVGTQRKYSDRLLLALLAARRPEKYREAKQEADTGALAELIEALKK